MTVETYIEDDNGTALTFLRTYVDWEKSQQLRACVHLPQVWDNKWDTYERYAHLGWDTFAVIWEEFTGYMPEECNMSRKEFNAYTHDLMLERMSTLLDAGVDNLFFTPQAD